MNVSLYHKDSMTDLYETPPSNNKGTTRSTQNKENRVNGTDSSRDYKRRKTNHSKKQDSISSYPRKPERESHKRDETPYKSGSSDLTMEDRSHIYSPLEETENTSHTLIEDDFKWPSWLDPDGRLARENPYAKYFENNEPHVSPPKPDPKPQQIPDFEFKEVPLYLTPTDDYVEVDTSNLSKPKALLSGDGWKRSDDGTRHVFVNSKFLPKLQEPIQDPRISSNFYS